MEIISNEVDQFGHARLGGIGTTIAQEIESRTGFETRVTILGHVQRGGTPTAFDRVLATRFGIAAIDAVHDGAFGQMVALQCGEIVRVPLQEAVGSSSSSTLRSTTASPSSSSPADRRPSALGAETLHVVPRRRFRGLRRGLIHRGQVAVVGPHDRCAGIGRTGLRGHCGRLAVDRDAHARDATASGRSR